MKLITKFFIFSLSIALLLPWNHTTAKAAIDNTVSQRLTDTTQTTITYDDQGGYFVETLESSLPSLNTNTSSINASTTTIAKSGSKTVQYFYHNTLCWGYVLTATFNVKMGVSVTYKTSKASMNDYASWTLVSESHSGSKGKATGTIKMKKNGATISKTINIYCDQYGDIY